MKNGRKDILGFGAAALVFTSCLSAPAPEVETMTISEVLALPDLSSHIEVWVNDVEAFCLEEGTTTRIIPGYRSVIAVPVSTYTYRIQDKTGQIVLQPSVLNSDKPFECGDNVPPIENGFNMGISISEKREDRKYFLWEAVDAK